MITTIEIYTKTPFGIYVKSCCLYDENTKRITMTDKGEISSDKTIIDLRLAIENDIKSITEDVNAHKLSDRERYKDYDIDDIVLESIKIQGEKIVCCYTINAGDYRRSCVGVVSDVVKNKYTNEYIVCPPVYSGKVCW